MSTTPITHPLPGEQILDLAPTDALEAAATWLRRPNLFAGRALTATTLEARNRWASGHLVLRGQSLSAGVVDGLELGYSRAPAKTGLRPKVTLHIGAGRGLAASGEDCALARDIQVHLDDLPVLAPAALFAAAGLPQVVTGDPLAPLVGPSLGQLLQAKAELVPQAGLVLLQPVTVDLADVDNADPCDHCGCGENDVNFDDWRLADGVRLVWYPWPDDWQDAIPLAAAASPRFRNRLAYKIFDSERQLGTDELLPWEAYGLAIALIGLDADHLPVFADRAAVVRSGGRARASRLQLGSRSSGELQLAPRPRLAPLWQAQLEQLAGQIADLGEPLPDAASQAQAFDQLPPCGLLPTNGVDLSSFSTGFFPAGFDLDAVPIPYEQLDLVIRESAPLAPLNLALGERVRIMVPVSQASWEPRLLLTESLDPLFQQTLDGYLLQRARALGARQGLRLAAATLKQAIDASTPVIPDISADPEALESESLAPWGPPPKTSGGHRALLKAGLHQHYFESATTTLTPAAAESLYAWVYLDPDNPPQTLLLQWRVGGSWEHRAYWGADLTPWGSSGSPSRLRLGDLPPLGQWLRLDIAPASLDLAGQTINGMAFTLYDGRAAFGASGKLVVTGESPWFGGQLPAGAIAYGDYPWDFITANGLWAPFESDLGLIANANILAQPAGESSAIRELLDGGALANLSGHEIKQLPLRGLQGFIDYLSSRTDRADDIIDFAFLKVQTDIYRVRQLILGTSDATRLAVSPTLAGIARADTAMASQLRISSFFNELKTSTAASSSTYQPMMAMLKMDVAAENANPVVNQSSNSIRVGAGMVSLGSSAGKTNFKQTGIASTIGKLAEVQAAKVALDSGIGLVAKKSGFQPMDIANASPLVGKADIRTVSIAERLAQPKAMEARDYASASRVDALNRLLDLADSLRAEDSEKAGQAGETSGLFANLAVFGANGDPFLEASVSRQRPFADFIGSRRNELLPLLLSAPVRKDNAGNVIEADESRHFSDATDVADTTVALLRQMEGRVRQFRDVISACRLALSSLQSDYNAALSRLQSWDEKLAEARHDVAVSRALMADEQARLDAINSRRQSVLANEVRFLAYARVRDADNLLTPPVHHIDPGLMEAALPGCLRAHPDQPDELVAMLAVLRDAPAAWFGQGGSWFTGLNRIDLLVKTVKTSQLRSQISAATAVAPPVANGLAGAIAKLTVKHNQVVSLARSASLQIDTLKLSALTWQGALQQAVQVVSLGDLISGDHGQGAVSKRAADFYHQFAEVCTCLHAEFSGVLPVIRLDWATRLSEYDAAPNLRNLASLPRWSEIAFLDRRRMQSFVDWLFSQASASESRAQDLVNDIVRMCLLLASHAPVDRIVAGRLPRPVTARPGIHIPLVALDPSRLRIGMHALVYSANQIVARALVEDLGSGELSARVLHTSTPTVELNESMRVHFADVASVGFASKPVSALR